MPPALEPAPHPGCDHTRQAAQTDPAVPFPPDSAPDQPVSGPRPVTAECSLEFCCFQHLPASIFIVTVSSASPKGPQDHFLLIFVKTRERSVYAKHCHELADAAGQAWGRRGQPVWGPPGAEAVVWPGQALTRAPPGWVPPLETLPRSVFRSLWPSEWPCLCHFDTLIPWKTPLGCRPAPAHQTHPLLGHLDFSEVGSAPAIQGRVRMGRLETPAVFCPHAKPGDVRACRAGPLEPTGLRPTPRPPLFLLTDGRSKWPVEQEGLVYPGRGRLG